MNVRVSVPRTVPAGCSMVKVIDETLAALRPVFQLGFGQPASSAVGTGTTAVALTVKFSVPFFISDAGMVTEADATKSTGFCP